MFTDKKAGVISGFFLGRCRHKELDVLGFNEKQGKAIGITGD